MGVKIFTLKEARALIDNIVDFILNSYTDVGTQEDLAERINDSVLAEAIFTELEKLSKRSPAKYRKLFAPESGDITIRCWVWSILTEKSS